MQRFCKNDSYFIAKLESYRLNILVDSIICIAYIYIPATDIFTISQKYIANTPKNLKKI